MTQLTVPFSTIVEALTARTYTPALGARFINRSGEAVFHPYSDILERAKSVAGMLQAKGLVPGDRVGIILPTSINFFDVFLGVIFAGGIPAALYPPFRLGRLSEYYSRTRRMLSKIGTRFLVVDERVGKVLGPVVESLDTIETVFTPGSLLGSARWTPVAVDPDSPAFLQFSSGTTVDPKAVIVSHTNLLSNLEMMDIIFRMYSRQELSLEAVCWLPLYHDMGLVGVLFNGLYHPETMNYVEPDVFIAKPALWLQTISRYGAGISPAPNFAYNLCANKIKDEEMAGVDLSCWKVAMSGSEQIDPHGMKRFSERFARWGFRESAVTPVYGLAEAALAVTFSKFMDPPLIKEFDRVSITEQGMVNAGSGYEAVSVGRPLRGIEIRICYDDDTPVGDGCIGKIMVRGPSVTPGYFGDPETTATTIRDGWLDTGDLGFICEGSLYITGRTKDIIIIRGQNIAPQAVETLVYDMPGIRAGCVAAVSTIVEGEGEQLIVLAERNRRTTRSEETLVEAIREKIIAGVGLSPHLVRILEPGTLPRTSSGKIRRVDTLKMFLAGKLVPPEKMGAFGILKEVAKSRMAWRRFRQKRHIKK